PPPGWGRDDLNFFFDLFRTNVYGSFHNLPEEYHCLRLVDEAYVGISRTLTDDRDWMQSLFVHKSHSIYRAGAQLAMGGQFSEVFVLLRSCLESSLCAHYLHVNEELRELWMGRHESEENRKKVRKKFQSGRLKVELTQAAPEVAVHVNALYEMCIDLGGHPNEKWLTATLREYEQDGARQFYSQYLTDDPGLMIFAMTSCARVGLATLLIYRQIFPERFQTLAVRDDLAGLEQLVFSEGYEAEWNFS
ncbi:MAG: hypothetical protein KKB70_06010, partial [Proteobacteria bacterium]|nr:hypothetical protein [Pseudomonadota bacterium]